MDDSQPVEDVTYLHSEVNSHGLLRAIREKVRIVARADVRQIVLIDDVSGEPIVPVEQTVNRLINVFRILRRCGLEVLSAKELAGILETTLRVESTFELIRTFSVGAGTASDMPGTAEQIATQTELTGQAVFQDLGLVMAKTFFLGDYFISSMDGVGEQFATISSLALEAKEMVAEIRSLALQEIKSSSAGQFEREAANHKRSVTRWTLSTLACAVTGISWLLYDLLILKQKIALLPSSKLFALEALQLALAAFIFYLMVICSRNVRSHRHNQTLNIQKANTLKGASLLIDGRAELRAQDMVLLEAIRSAFATGKTGFDD